MNIIRMFFLEIVCYSRFCSLSRTVSLTIVTLNNQISCAELDTNGWQLCGLLPKRIWTVANRSDGTGRTTWNN